MLYQFEVTESRKSIKKMINIHVGDVVSICRWDQPNNLHLAFSLTHTLTFIYITGAVNGAVQPVVTGVLGGGDQKVNMIQSTSFIKLMKVITVYRERKAVRLT